VINLEPAAAFLNFMNGFKNPDRTEFVQTYNPDFHEADQSIVLAQIAPICFETFHHATKSPNGSS
jgi:hypothetical protein